MLLERSLLAAQGYIELDMTDEALRELGTLSPEDQEREDVKQMQLFIFMRTKQWDRALLICQRLRESSPDGTTGFIHGAFCLHEMGRTKEARELLMQGPPILLGEPTYHYNLGCYDAVLGHLEEAAIHLEISFKMDHKFREIARLDPDLKPLQSLLGP